MASILSLSVVYLLIALAVWLYWRRCRYWARRFKNIPSTGSRAYPIIGHIYLLLGANRGYIEKAYEIARRCGIVETRNVSYAWAGEYPVMTVLRPEDVEVLLGSAHEIVKPEVLYKAIGAFFGDGLITLNGQDWQRHRKVLTPTFHFKILERYVEIFKKHAEGLVEEVRAPGVKGVEVNVMPLMARAVSQTICETAFGMSERLSQRDEVKKREAFFEALDLSFKAVRSRVLRPWLYPDTVYQFTSLYRKQKKAEKVISDYASRIIRMKREEIAQDEEDDNGTEDDDIGAKKKVAFLDLVLRNAKNVFSEEETLNEVRTLVTVQQTTASTLSFILVMLGIHQDIQEEVYREICDVDKHSESRSYYERLGEMKYLERVIKETLRLYPVTVLFARHLKQDLVTRNCTLPAGVFCVVCPLEVHKDKSVYGPNPEKFDPDHFLPERCRTRHPYAYIPFSAGPRNCIGQKYAMLQMKAIVSTVVRNLRIFSGKGCHSQEDLLLEIDLFLHIMGGFNVRFEPRDVVESS